MMSILWTSLAVAAPAARLNPAHVAEVAEAAELSVAEVEKHLRGVKRDDSVLERMARPYEAKPWHEYRKLFLTEERIEAGRAFRAEHAATLARAEATYGVPASIVLAILGVETRFGETMGNDAVVTALYTLGFHHERRGDFFRRELGEYLRLATDQGWKIGERQGSYAGAMGLGQFMPSSYRAYAVDFDGDGAIDLFGSPADAIGSVANYLAEHGWVRHAPVLLDVPIRGEWPPRRGLTLNASVGELRARGAAVPDWIADSARARVFVFEGEEGSEARVGFQNFWVITRYNRSTLYARAVAELAAAF